MKLEFYHILGYLGLGLTCSYSSAFALFAVHFYNASSVCLVVPKLNNRQLLPQVISTILGCAGIVYLYNASISEMKATLFPLFITTFLLPFCYISSKEVKKPKDDANIYNFLISFGVFTTLHHFVMTYMVANERWNIKTVNLAAFGYPYQYAISVDLISLTLILSIFILLELHELHKIQLDFSYLFCKAILKLLPCLLGLFVVTFLISPGAMLAFFLAYREATASNMSDSF